MKWLPTVARRLHASRPLDLSKPNQKSPTSGLEPLTCSSRVIHQALQGIARACKTRISRRLSLLWVAECCTVLRSRWYHSGINTVPPCLRRRVVRD